MKQPTDTRARILQAAFILIRTEGVSNLTLEAVARAAEVSKGGLLYHFPSKDALVEGMVQALGQRFTAALNRQREDAPDQGQPGGWLRAYATATLRAEPQEQHAAMALLAAVATRPELLDPLRQQYADWQQAAVQDGIDPALATILRLAVDGLWYADLLGLAPLAEPLRTQVLQRLLALSRQDAGWSV